MSARAVSSGIKFFQLFERLTSLCSWSARPNLWMNSSTCRIVAYPHLSVIHGFFKKLLSATHSSKRSIHLPASWVVGAQAKAVAAPGVDVQFGGHFELFELE